MLHLALLGEGPPHVRRSLGEGGCRDRLSTKDFPPHPAKGYPVITMADTNDQPNYVNDLPDDCPENTPRCQHVFQERVFLLREGIDLYDRPCGLPVPEDEIGHREQLCYFHSKRARENDRELKSRLEEVVAGGAYLAGVHLAQAQLQQAELGRARLPRANLKGANLMLANLHAADLRGAEMHASNLELANLQGATLQFAGLSGTRLWSADLAGADLRQADLQGSFVHLVSLCGADLGGADLRKAAVTRTTIGSVQMTDKASGLTITKICDMRDARLESALLWEARIAPDADLTNVTYGDPGVTRRAGCWWWPWWRWTQYHLQDERCARSYEEWAQSNRVHRFSDDAQPTFGECEILYRQLKLNYQESGDYQTAGEFFVREMECKRAQMVEDTKDVPALGRLGLLLAFAPLLVPAVARLMGVPVTDGAWFVSLVAVAVLVMLGVWSWPIRQRIWPAIMYFVCGYGERPGWIVACIMAPILVFAGFHTWAGVADLKAGAEVNAATPNGVVHSFWTALYFSVITFTSLGYADLAPTSGISRVLAGVEAVLGIVMMSLFLICIVRKFSR